MEILAGEQGAKHTKVFDGTCCVGLARDGTDAGRSEVVGDELCRPIYKAAHTAVVKETSFRIDVEPYGSGKCKYGAGKRCTTP